MPVTSWKRSSSTAAVSSRQLFRLTGRDDNGRGGPGGYGLLPDASGRRRLATVRGTILFAVFTMIAMAASAGETIREPLTRASGAYDRGAYAAALDSLLEAEESIRGKLAAICGKLLPEQHLGWSERQDAGEGTGPVPVARIPRGATPICVREYVRGDSRVVIRVMAGASMEVQSLLNPMTIAARGGSRIRVGQREAVLIYEARTRSGEVGIPLFNNLLATVDGLAVADRRELAEFAESVNWEVLRGLY